MTPAEALYLLTAEARRAGRRMSKTTQSRLLYLTDLRAHRHGSEEVSGLNWIRTSNGPFDRSIAYLSKGVTPSDEDHAEWRSHAEAVISACGHLSHAELGAVCKGSAPMRKSRFDGEVLDLDAVSSNDLSAFVTQPRSD